MGRKRPSLSHQMWQKLQEIDHIGQSRHELKEADRANGVKGNRITSHKSYDNYKNASKQFCKWLKEYHPNIKNLKDVTREMGVDYIKYREQIGRSAWTYSQDLVAVNKLLDTDITKKECGVEKRRLENRTKNQVDNGYRTKDKIAERFIEGSGLRKRELQHLKLSNCIMEGDELVAIRVYRAKGGRYRVAQVRKEYREELGSIINSKRNNTQNDLLFDKPIPKRLQCHRFRHTYAKGYCEELIDKGISRNEVLDKLTQSMGHNRHDVLKSYGTYIYKYNKKNKSQ